MYDEDPPVKEGLGCVIAALVGAGLLLLPGFVGVLRTILP